MLRYLYLVVFVVLLNANFAAAAKVAAPVKPKMVLKADSSAISIREFNKKTLANYSKLPEFQYQDEVYEPSLWTRFWRWFWHWVASLFKRAPGSGSLVWVIVKYLFIVLGVGAIVLMLLKMMGIDMLNIFRRRGTDVSIPYSESLEDIHHIDFDAEIERASGQHNYRLAVRLLYLKSLKQLSDAMLINWQPDKTNNAYIDELNDQDQRKAFKQLTRQFEYIWYGEFPIDGGIYNDINLMFKQFKTKIA